MLQGTLTAISGNHGGGTLIIESTKNGNDEWVLDKTYAEILTAIKQGKALFVHKSQTLVDGDSDSYDSIEALSETHPPEGLTELGGRELTDIYYVETYSESYQATSADGVLTN